MSDSPLGKSYLRATFPTETGDVTVCISTNLAEMIGGAGAGLRKRREDLEASEKAKTPPPPVDRESVTLTTGEPVPEDHSHTEKLPNGQQKGYVVLSDAERGKGFVRPFRDAYRHVKCGKITTMGRALAETYARDPAFYSGTFCTHCGSHFPVGEDGEFTWYEMDGREGPKVGT